MQKAAELLRQGRDQELWQMCCGYMHFDIGQFMEVQKRLLLGQIELLNKSAIGQKIFGRNIIRTVEDFREAVPLTAYLDYCPELIDRREDILPQKPAQWIHTSGKSGEYTRKWVPMTSSFIENLSPILYGIGLMSSCKTWGDSSRMPNLPNIIYTVAPRPYMSGALASMIGYQTPLSYHPDLEKAETLSFEERVKLGFDEALSSGLDYFFGLSIVLSMVGDKFNRSTGKSDIKAYFSRPRALARLARGTLKSRLAGRNLLPKDLWQVKGIITSGLDSSVYKNKIKEYWGRYPLDIYSSTEGGVIATQAWDYQSMTFIPNLNFLEFIPEKEHLKWQIDHSYQPRTVLMDEVKSGESYEIVITNFHGGALARYRIGDMVRITALNNQDLGIGTPQMVFDRRADDLIDLGVVRLTEKSIWQAVENIGVPYADWIAFKQPGELTLNILLEPDTDMTIDELELEKALYHQILKKESETLTSAEEKDYLENILKFNLKLSLLPRGTFKYYTSQRILEGADIAHLKPPHINPQPKILEMLNVYQETVPQTAGSPSMRRPTRVGG